MAVIAIFLSAGLNAMQNAETEALVAKIQTACKTVAPTAKNITITPLAEGGSGHRKKFTCTLDDKKYLACALGAPYIKRRQEIEAHRLAVTFGYAPAIHFCNDDYALIIMDFVEGKTLRLHDCSSICVLHQVADLCKKLAAQQSSFSDNKFFADIYNYGNQLLAQKTPLSELITHALEKTKRLEERIAAQHRPMVFCHHDLHSRNMFFANKTLTVIDWEEAGLDCEFFDLAYFSTFTCLDAHADLELLTRYLGTVPSAEDREYFVQLKFAIRVFDALRLFTYIPPQDLKTYACQPPGSIEESSYYDKIFADADYDPLRFPAVVYAMAYSELTEFLQNVDTVLSR